MFDWDEDYDGLIAAAPMERPLNVATSPQRRRTVIGLWIVAGSLALGVGAYAISGKFMFKPEQAQPDPFAALPFGVAGLSRICRCWMTHKVPVFKPVSERSRSRN